MIISAVPFGFENSVTAGIVSAKGRSLPMGLSFAIPMDIAMDVVKQLRESDKVTRGRIGVQVQERTADLAASFGLKDANGALVAMVEKDGPATSAGILPDDVIRAFDGKPIQTSAELTPALRERLKLEGG